MTLSQALGFLASGLVLLTFGMRTMGPMRVAAIGSNLAFIAYGLQLDLTPVWLLHGILLPLNAYRLLEWQQARRRQARGEARPAARRRGALTRGGAPSARAAGRQAGGGQTVLAHSTPGRDRGPC
jgi:hypothetical protein